MVPWAGLTAAEISHEVLGLANELDLSSPRVASDPFNTVLQYGLRRNPDLRHLSLEQIRDLLAEHRLVVTTVSLAFSDYTLWPIKTATLLFYDNFTSIVVILSF